MAETTIEWTASRGPDGAMVQGYSWNPWVGCTKVSPACDRCYAERWAYRTGQSDLWAGARRRTAPANWRGPFKWNSIAAVAGTRPRVFCASLADVFDNQVPPEWRADVWNLIVRTPHLDWLLLTKRPQNIGKMFPLEGMAPPNVWFGTTTENQTEADRRILALRTATPDTAIRFLSVEPMVEPVRPDLAGISWVICGGETGHGARIMDPDWARALRDQCATAGVGFFMKQMSKGRPIPDDLMVRQDPSMVHERD